MGLIPVIVIKINNRKSIFDTVLFLSTTLLNTPNWDKIVYYFLTAALSNHKICVDFCLDQSESIYTTMSGDLIPKEATPPPVPLVPPPELTPPPPIIEAEPEHDYENICIVKQKIDDICKQSDTTSEKSSSLSDNNTIITSRDYYLLLRGNNHNNNNNNMHITESNKLDNQVRKADMFQIALAATKTSTESLDIRKFGKINNKNIYIDEPEVTPKRSNSLEGLLNNVLKESPPTNLKNINESVNQDESGIWEEDNIWQENLRRASHRHARSLDDLQIVTSTPSKSKLSRGVTYVNDSPPARPSSSMKTKNDKSFIIDREKLRQWDLMSSAPALTANGKQLQITNMIPKQEKLVTQSVEVVDKQNIDKHSGNFHTSNLVNFQEFKSASGGSRLRFSYILRSGETSNNLLTANSDNRY